MRNCLVLGALALAGALGFWIIPAAAAAATETVVYSFCSQDDCADGAYSSYGLTKVEDTLYGTADYGGNNPVCLCGTAFALDSQTGSYTTLYSFCSQSNCIDGASPEGGLTSHLKHELWGTTTEGGSGHCLYGCGTVFSVDPATGAEAVLYAFDGGADGGFPMGNLRKINHTLYGTTEFGGSDNAGTVFSVNANTGAEKVIYAFQNNGADAELPGGGLFDVNGTLFGTTFYGGANRVGTIFTVNPNTGQETVVHSFSINNTDGYYPQAGFVEANGTLYGVTYFGGAHGSGTVFSFVPATGVEQVLYSFNSQTGDGVDPNGGLNYANGSLYGVTLEGGDSGCNGTSGCGTVYAINLRTNSETVLHAFGAYDGDGQEPYGNLVNVNGTLYGVTFHGGSYGYGTVFAVTP